MAECARRMTDLHAQPMANRAIGWYSMLYDLNFMSCRHSHIACQQGRNWDAILDQAHTPERG